MGTKKGKKKDVVVEEETDVVVEEETVEAKPPYYVAAGKSIVCKKGIIDQGGEVKIEYLSNAKDLERLVKKGIVIKS